MLGHDNLDGPYACLVERDIRHVQRMYAAGHQTHEIAAAMGVHRRTVLRYREARVVTVEVEGWPIKFLIRHPGAVPKLMDRVELGRQHPPRRHTNGKPG